MVHAKPADGWFTPPPLPTATRQNHPSLTDEWFKMTSWQKRRIEKLTHAIIKHKQRNAVFWAGPCGMLADSVYFYMKIRPLKRAGSGSSLSSKPAPAQTFS
jgi:hypothetical protein